MSATELAGKKHCERQQERYGFKQSTERRWFKTNLHKKLKVSNKALCQKRRKIEEDVDKALSNVKRLKVRLVGSYRKLKRRHCMKF